MIKRFFFSRKFAFFWSGQAVSALGTWIDYVVLNLYAYKLFGSAAVLSSFFLVRLVPALFFGPLGGWMADRFSRRSILISCDVLRALMVASFIVVKSLPLFFVLGFLLAALDKVAQAVQTAYIPDLVPRSKLYEANGMMRATASLSTVIGPAVGAFLVSGDRFAQAFAVDAASFVVSALALVAIRRKPQVLKELERQAGNWLKTAPLGEASKASSQAVPETLTAILKASPDLAGLFLVRFVDALGGGAFMLSLPILAESFQAFGSSYYGWLLSIWSLGALWGSLGLTKHLKKMPVFETFTAAVVVMALGMGVTFNMAVPIWALLAILVGGLGDGISGLLFQTAVVKAAPDKLRGRLSGTAVAVMHTGSVVGLSLAGLLMSYISMGALTAGAACMTASAALLALAARRLRPGRLDEVGGEK